MGWTNEPKDRTHGPYNLKVVANVIHPTMTTAEVWAWVEDVVLVTGAADVRSKFASDYFVQSIFVGTDPRVRERPDFGGWQIYPKMYALADLKQNRDEQEAILEVYNAWRDGFETLLLRDGFTVLELSNKPVLV